METPNNDWEGVLAVLTMAKVEYIFDEQYKELMVFLDNKTLGGSIATAFTDPEAALEYVFDTHPKYHNI